MCHFCEPDGLLVGKRCTACERVYEMHILAEQDDAHEQIAVRWIYEHAAEFRRPHNVARLESIEQRQQAVEIKEIAMRDVTGGRPNRNGLYS